MHHNIVTIGDLAGMDKNAIRNDPVIGQYYNRLIDAFERMDSNRGEEKEEILIESEEADETPNDVNDSFGVMVTMK